jgi:transcriptional regulator with XRE-family HTH domain
MNTYRIRELRKQKKWSQGTLAQAVGWPTSAICKLEKGNKQLRVSELEKLAEVFNVSVADVLGVSSEGGQVAPGFSDDVAVYDAGERDPFKGLITENRYLLTVTGDTLDKAGIRRGDVVVVDNSAAAVKGLKPLDFVHVQYHPDGDMTGKAIALLRQFVPPSMLVTNSGTRNEKSLDTDIDDAQILGVVVSSHRALHG